MLYRLLPVWEVFDCRSGVALGFARAGHHSPANEAIARAAGVSDRYLGASLVPIDALDLVPARLPAVVTRRNHQ